MAAERITMAYTEQTQECPQCGESMDARSGAWTGDCKNCGYHDPCCE